MFGQQIDIKHVRQGNYPFWQSPSILGLSNYDGTCCGLCILVQYSDKFMHNIVLYSIVLSRSQLYCIVNLLLCGYNTIQCYA